MVAESKGDSGKFEFDRHLFPADRFVGAISKVESGNARFKFSNPDREVIQAAVDNKYLAIETGKIGVFAQIMDIHHLEPQGSEEDSGLSAEAEATLELLMSIDRATGQVSRGVTQVPQVGDLVYAAPVRLTQAVFETRTDAAEHAGDLHLEFAQLRDSANTQLHFTPERIFGRHCAILGTSGGGKSWSIAKLSEECAKCPNSKVILFDAVGEYHTLSGGVRHVHIGHDPKPRKNSREVGLPWFDLTETDLFAIFKPSGDSQTPKLRAAMKSLKLAKLEPGLAPNGTIIKAHKNKVQIQEAYNYHIERIEQPMADFDVRRLITQIENECVNPNRSASEPLIWGGPNNTDRSLCVSLQNRIQDIINSPNLDPIFSPTAKRSLIEVIDYFLQDRDSRVLRVSLKYLSFQHSAREIIMNAVGRHLLSLARDDAFKKQPLLLILDEAHQFLNNAIEHENEHLPLDSFSLIAKEGRKYSLNICLATQRPRDIPEGVLSQMGTLLVHRLINDFDRTVVERAASEMDSASANSMPSLAPGEAILVGVGFPVPLGVKVSEPKCKPDSAGPNFQSYWSTPSSQDPDTSDSNGNG